MEKYHLQKAKYGKRKPGLYVQSLKSISNNNNNNKPVCYHLFDRTEIDRKLKYVVTLFVCLLLSNTDVFIACILSL